MSKKKEPSAMHPNACCPKLKAGAFKFQFFILVFWACSKALSNWSGKKYTPLNAVTERVSENYL